MHTVTHHRRRCRALLNHISGTCICVITCGRSVHDPCDLSHMRVWMQNVVERRSGVHGKRKLAQPRKALQAGSGLCRCIWNLNGNSNRRRAKRSSTQRLFKVSAFSRVQCQKVKPLPLPLSVSAHACRPVPACPCRYFSCRSLSLVQPFQG